MAKKTKYEDDTSESELPEAAPPPPPPMPKAAHSPPAAAASMPLVKKYRVGRKSHYVKDGSVHTLHEGAVLDETQYDIAALQAQDVPLQEMP